MDDVHLQDKMFTYWKCYLVSLTDHEKSVVSAVWGWICLVRDWERMDHVSRQLAKEPQNHSALPHQYVRSQQWPQPLALCKLQHIFIMQCMCVQCPPFIPQLSYYLTCVLRWNEWWFTWAEIRLCSCWRSWCLSLSWWILLAQLSLTWTTPHITASPPVTRSPPSPQVNEHCTVTSSWPISNAKSHHACPMLDANCFVFALSGTTSSSNTMVPGNDGHHDNKIKDSNMEDR